MERPPGTPQNTRTAFRTLQVVDNSNLELLFSTNISAPSSTPLSISSTTESAPAQQGALYRIKRRRDEPLETIVLESTTAKKPSIESIGKSLGALSTQDAPVIVAPSSTTLTNPNATTLTPAALSNRAANLKKGPKVFRRLETISARVASERGLMAIVESIKRHREGSGSARQKTASRKQAASRQHAREKVLESTRQLSRSAEDAEKKSQSQSQQPQPQFPLAVSLKQTRPAPPSQEEILLNYMPLVRKFLNTEREKETADVARKEAEALDAELDEYAVEIFAEAKNGDLPEGQALRVKVEPFDFDPANEYASDDDNDSARDSDDTEDPEHPNNDYPDRDEDEDGEEGVKKKPLHDEDDEDEDADSEEEADDAVSSDGEDVAWAPGPAKYRPYHQRSADSDSDE